MGYYDDWYQIRTPEGYSDESPPTSPEEPRDADKRPSTIHRIRKAAVSSSSGAISVGGCASELPSLPGLVVDGKRVPLPILENESNLAYLLSLATPSPHGKGEETVFDPKVRSSLQIEAEKISFEHPDWEAMLWDVTARVGRALNIPELEAVPYKFLIYREGDHFDPHRDTEKEVGMVATLVVQLPSVCKGGHLVIHDDNKAIVHDFGAASGLAAYQCHFAAHYADIRHSVTPVTEGVRIAMVYNLVTTPETAMATRTSLSERDRGLAGALRDWDMGSTPVVLTLRHVYTERGLAPGSAILKGDDVKIWQLIENANGQLEPGDRAVAALVTITREIDTDEGLEEVTRSDCTARVVSTLTDESTGVKSMTVIPSVHFVYTTSRAQFWRNRKSQQETTGNAGTTKHTTYTQSGILLIPSKYVLQMQISLLSTAGVISRFNSLTHLSDPSPRDKARRDEMRGYIKQQLKEPCNRFRLANVAGLATAFKDDASTLLLLLGICSRRAVFALELEAFTVIILQGSDALENVAFDPETLVVTAIEKTNGSAVASRTASSEEMPDKRLHFSKKAALAAVGAYMGLGEGYYGLVRKILTRITAVTSKREAYYPATRVGITSASTVAAARCLRHNAWKHLSEVLLTFATDSTECVKAFYEEIHKGSLEEAIGDQLPEVDAALLEKTINSTLKWTLADLQWLLPMAAKLCDQDAFLAILKRVEPTSGVLIDQDDSIVRLCSSLGKMWLDVFLAGWVKPRIRHLQEQFLSVPEHPMVMPFAKCSHPSIQSFLRGSQTKMIFSGIFTSIRQARHFSIPRNTDGYTFSCTYKAGGRGSQAFVEITKTDSWHEWAIAQNESKQRAINKLQSWLNFSPSASQEQQHTGKRTAEEALAQANTAKKQRTGTPTYASAAAGGAPHAVATSAYANVQANADGLEVIELE